MKKITRIFALLLVVLILVCCTVIANAEGDLDLPEIGKQTLDGYYLDTSSLLKKTEAGKAVDLSTQDVVTVLEDGSINIVSKNVSMTITPPFGWVVFTQDVLAQLDVYMTYVTDIEEMQNMIKNIDAQALCLDLVSDMKTIIKVTENPLAKLLGNMKDTRESHLSAVQDVLQSSYGATDSAIVEEGENKYIKLSGKEAGNVSFILYTTFINDRAVEIYCLTEEEDFSDFSVMTIESMLTDLKLV